MGKMSENKINRREMKRNRTTCSNSAKQPKRKREPTFFYYNC